MARMHARLTGSDELEMGELDSFETAGIHFHPRAVSVVCASSLVHLITKLAGCVWPLLDPRDSGWDGIITEQ
jgi:hypothetical protein